MTYNSDHVNTKLIDPNNRSRKAQVGVDLTVLKIEEIKPEVESISGLNTVIRLDENSKLQGVRYVEAGRYGNEYNLNPNTSYAVTFEQGLTKLNNNEWAEITQRSSLNRAGVKVQGSIYDPGFYCDNLGATIYTSNNSIKIPIGARIAQILIPECEDTTNAYNGRWQGKANG